MTGILGILRVWAPIAYSATRSITSVIVLVACCAATLIGLGEQASAQGPPPAPTVVRTPANGQSENLTARRGLPMLPQPLSEVSEIDSQVWDFGRTNDTNFDNEPDDWKRYRGVGYPRYVNMTIAARDPELEKQFQALDTAAIRAWRSLKESYPKLPLPPSMTDIMVDRFLRIDLDGGQFKIQSPAVEASRLYQYRFSCKVFTRGLRHDRARAELVFLSEDNQELSTHTTQDVQGNQDWTEVQLQLVRPPLGATKMLVRLMVLRSETGLEDIRGTIGFDDVRIDQYPQLQLTTDESFGIYKLGQRVVATAKIMGLPAGMSDVVFKLLDSEGNEVGGTRLAVDHNVKKKNMMMSRGMSGSTTKGKFGPRADLAAGTSSMLGAKDEAESIDSVVQWTLPKVRPGYYRLTAVLDGTCLLYTSPSPRDRQKSRMPSSA